MTDASNIRTLYIDRDPATFQEIARHLQGIHGSPWAHGDTADGSQATMCVRGMAHSSSSCSPMLNSTPVRAPPDAGSDPALTTCSASIDVPAV